MTLDVATPSMLGSDPVQYRRRFRRSSVKRSGTPGRSKACVRSSENFFGAS